MNKQDAQEVTFPENALADARERFLAIQPEQIISQQRHVLKVATEYMVLETQRLVRKNAAMYSFPLADMVNALANSLIAIEAPDNAATAGGHI